MSDTFVPDPDSDWDPDPVDDLDDDFDPNACPECGSDLVCTDSGICMCPESECLWVEVSDE